MNFRIKSFLAVSFIVLSSFVLREKNTLKETTVYVFLSETCPICQSYTLTLKDLYKKYNLQKIKFVGIFPNYYSTQKSIDEFKKKYSIPFELILDKKGELTNRFSATITPEVFIESTDNKILYRGRIDDSFYSLGKRRTIITSTELADALSEISLKQTIKIFKTQAVGCVISASK
jgi:thiol-disulfide isomerase/thioredoxin